MIYGEQGFLFLWYKLLLDRLLLLYYPCAFSIDIFTCLFIKLQETLVHRQKEGIVSWPVMKIVWSKRVFFFFFYRYGPRQAQYQIRNQKSKLILHQNSWTEITISGELEQNVPQSFVSQMDRWGRHLLAVHEIKQISPRQKSQCPTVDPPY